MPKSNTNTNTNTTPTTPRRSSRRGPHSSPAKRNDDGDEDDSDVADSDQDRNAILKTQQHQQEESTTENQDDSTTATMTTSASQKRSSRKKKIRKDLDTLHQEMEVAVYARTATGHLRRKVPKAQSSTRTRKRKVLEAADDEQFGVDAEPVTGRLRGSQAAIDDSIVNESKVFPRLSSTSNRKSSRRKSQHNDGSSSDDDEESAVADDEEEEDEAMVEDEDNEGGDELQDGDDDEEEEVDLDEEEDEEEQDDEGSVTEEPSAEDPDPDPEKEEPVKKKVKTRKFKRKMYRLKNFKSQRMAQRHGDALAAHARGQPLVAIELLKQVAKEAPSAPQVYSSLGMVYEDMLKQSQKRSAPGTILTEPSTTGTTTETPTSTTDNKDESTTVENSLPDPALAEQLDLAKKAYGSYHIAAILCKKDFTLWVRAADAGATVADIHGRVMLLPNISLTLVAYHRSERQRWYSEVLRDIQAGDNLKPPGMEVPAKLAATHMELGNLSEALTILTDLKNTAPIVNTSGRGPFQSSYKAWLLYADLMLRIGHECIQWNRGIRTNDNYMFRRWLRKYSHLFDWQERRLQALCLALEASGGTKSTESFIHWMRQRSEANHGLQHEKEKESSRKDRWHVNALDVSLIPSESDGNRKESIATTPTEQQEVEKKLLLEKNRSEMEAFDQTTIDMDLTPHSAAYEDRQTNRNDMLQAHNDAMTTLDSEYRETNNVMFNPVDNAKGEDEIMGSLEENPLPVSASCRHVCEIGSELMKHLHGLELFTGARLVGESVSQYLKERAAKHDKRLKAQQRLDDWQEKVTKSPFVFETYDEGSDSDDSEDSVSSLYLSDGEDLDEGDSSELLESLRKGTLPPELRVLFGLALVGEGGKNFLAGKCLEAIELLEQESISWLTEGEMETERSGMPLWYLFRRAMTEPLGRTAAFAFLADVMRKTEKEQEWSVHFSSWFRRHVGTMKNVGLTEQLLGLRDNLSPFVNFRKNQLLKVILASCKLDVDTAESPAKQSPVNREMIVTEDAERVTIALSAIKSLSEVLYLMWKVDADGSLPSMCLEVVKMASRCLQWLGGDAKDKLSYSQLHTVMEHANTVMSFLGGGRALPAFKGATGTDDLTERDWGAFPVKTSWQVNDFRSISMRVYNLTVACNVSLFSGWEQEEFTLRLLRRRYGNKHFGVHLRDDRRVTGFLAENIEEALIRQWSTLYEVIPAFPDVNIAERLEIVKKSEWYIKEREERKTTLEGTPVARYCEEEAATAYLAFSALSLQLSLSESNPLIKSCLLQTSLSILLPITQFCVDDRLWDSDIGEAASSLSGFDEWRLMTGMGLESGMYTLPTQARRRRKPERTIERKVQEWIKGTGKPVLKSYVSIPTTEMKRLWNFGVKEMSLEEKESANECMAKVHRATLQLRGCYTAKAMEKTSLLLSVLLLDLGALPGCINPFLCLQQAAMFASQASKAGSSDTAYRSKLPEKVECTPPQALDILGRADCLHSVYFPNEAAFLCSYVALVCRLHRDTEETTLEWSSQWQLVAIYAFNVSVMIRATVSTVLDKDMQKSFLKIWERDVVEELERGRSDGWGWKRRQYNSGNILPKESSIVVDDYEADELENNLEEEDEEEEGDNPEDEEDDHLDDHDDDDDMNTDDGEEGTATPYGYYPMTTLYNAELPLTLPVPVLPPMPIVPSGPDGEDYDGQLQNVEMVSV